MKRAHCEVKEQRCWRLVAAAKGGGEEEEEAKQYASKIKIESIQIRRQKQVQLTIATVIQFAVDFNLKSIIKSNLRNDQLQWFTNAKWSNEFYSNAISEYTRVFPCTRPDYLVSPYFFLIDKIDEPTEPPFLFANRNVALWTNPQRTHKTVASISQYGAQHRNTTSPKILPFNMQNALPF